MDIDIILLLIAAAFVAGAIDAVAGGGGLITIPALLLAGFDPLTAIGTNKVQAIFGSGSATIAGVRRTRAQAAMRRSTPRSISSLG